MTQAVLVKYMEALAAVADDGVVDYKKQITEVSSAASGAKFVEKADADLISGALNLIAKLATDASRQKLLREMVTRSDPAIQNITQALSESVQTAYLGMLNNEGIALEGFVKSPEIDKNPGSSRLARLVLRDYKSEIESRKKTVGTYVKALEKIAEGHATLAQHIGSFSSKEFITQMREFETELKELHKQLKN